MLKKLKKMYPHQSLMMIFIIGLLAIAGSLIVEFGFKIEPCEMCLWQRYIVIAITVLAFIGTLFRGRIKKVFLALISLAAATGMAIAVWQSLGQMGKAELPTGCSVAETITLENSQDLAASLNDTVIADCSKKEELLPFGITLANFNAVLMLLVAVFAFYKLFFKPRKRFKKRRHYHNNYNKHRNGNNKRRYRGSGYIRSNNRNRKRYDGNSQNSNNENNN